MSSQPTEALMADMEPRPGMDPDPAYWQAREADRNQDTPSGWRQWAQTIGDLKTWLAEHPDLPDDTPIIIEKDADGNDYSPLSAIYAGWYTPGSAVSRGYARGDSDVVTAEDAADHDDVREAVEEGNLYQLRDGDARCLVLGPLD